MNEDAALECVTKECCKNYMDLSNSFHDLADKVLVSKDIPAYMRLKVEGMLMLLSLPIDPDTCPFCTMAKLPDDNYNCADCWYAKMHNGKCASTDSDYQRLIGLQSELTYAINNYWTIKDTTEWNICSAKMKEAENAKFYKVGDTIKLTYLNYGSGRGVAPTPATVVITGLGYNTVQLFTVGFPNYYIDKQIQVQDVYKITEYEINTFVSAEVTIELIKRVVNLD